MDAKKLIELRKQAEKAVADMPDTEFKLKAFEVILNHLLAPGKSESVITTKSESKPQAQTAKDIEAESISGRILVLKDEGFFKSPKYIGEIRAELQAHGWYYPVTTLSGELINLVQKRKLRRQREKKATNLFGTTLIRRSHICLPPLLKNSFRGLLSVSKFSVLPNEIRSA